ncbi:MAG: biotin transporter BioY [Lachnospirales bacterium]
MNNSILSIKDMCLIGVFAAVICALGQISIPMPYGVPMTLQTFAISLAGVVLGAKKGFFASLIYVLLGAVGLPVFAGFVGGLGVVFGATGGFILSFPIMAWITGVASDFNNKTILVIGVVLGILINYLCGMFMFTFVTGNPLSVAFTACVLPFIPTSIIKAFLAVFLGLYLKTLLKREVIL